MIDVRELRIGNLVNELGIDYDSGSNMFNDPLGDEIIIIQLADLKNINNRPELYSPILLTEEWLLKSGFEMFDKESDDPYYRHDKLYGHIDYRLNYKIGTLKVKLKFLHELQNLYFALTKTELNFEM